MDRRLIPPVFSVPVVRCPNCDHGINPHGINPGGKCGVGDEQRILCECMWSPNDIAAALLESEGTQINGR